MIFYQTGRGEGASGYFMQVTISGRSVKVRASDHAGISLDSKLHCAYKHLLRTSFLGCKVPKPGRLSR